MLKINFSECTNLEEMYNLVMQEMPKAHGPGYEKYINTWEVHEVNTDNVGYTILRKK